MIPEKNDVGVAELDSRGERYRLWRADRWACPECGAEIVAGFGSAPQHDFHEEQRPFDHAIKSENAWDLLQL